MCVCACLSVCTCVHLFVHLYMCVCMCVYICMCVYVQVLLHACIYCLRLCVCSCSHTAMWVNPCECMCVSTVCDWMEQKTVMKATPERSQPPGVTELKGGGGGQVMRVALGVRIWPHPPHRPLPLSRRLPLTLPHLTSTSPCLYPAAPQEPKTPPLRRENDRNIDLRDYYIMFDKDERDI